MPLSDLIAALAAATGPSRELDERLATEVFGWRQCPNSGHWMKPPVPYFMPVLEPPAYTASLDAITGAVEQRWPDYRINAGWAADYAGVELFAGPPHVAAGDARSLPLALCLAAARLALAETDAR